MSKRYIFEIQALITKKIYANDVNQARERVMLALQDGDYDEELGTDAMISDGKEIPNIEGE